MVNKYTISEIHYLGLTDMQFVRLDDYAALESLTTDLQIELDERRAECEKLWDRLKKMTKSRNEWRDLAKRSSESDG